MFNLRKCLLAASVAGALGVAGTTAFALPITFAPTDYDNSASQTFGFFRDFLNGSAINRGLDLGGAATPSCPASSCSNPGTNTALNFTGSDNNAPFLGRVTLYDTTPWTATPTTFTGNMSVSADILVSRHNNDKGAGLLTMFNEGGTNKGLALFLSDAGNSDGYAIRLVQQNGVETQSNPANYLESVTLGDDILDDRWYRLMLGIAFTGSNFTITGQVFGHATGTNPNSALGAQIGSTLTYDGILGSGLSDPYEIGLVARGNGAVVDTSVTNFDFSGGRGTITPTIDVPVPGTMMLLGIGLAGLIGRGKRLKR